MDHYAKLLTEKQQQFLNAYYMENYSLTEIADDFQVSPQAVHLQMQRSIAKLEKYDQQLQLIAKQQTLLKLIEQLKNEPLSERVQTIVQHMGDVI